MAALDGGERLVGGDAKMHRRRRSVAMAEALGRNGSKMKDPAGEDEAPS